MLQSRCSAIATAFLAEPRFAAKLVSLPPAVQAEIRREVRGRAMGAASMGREGIGWREGDAEMCARRVG